MMHYYYIYCNSGFFKPHRVDAYSEDPSGSIGMKMYDEMIKKINKWQEPAPAKIVKPLPVPDLETKKRRGGRRLRKMKERYGLSEAQKMQNRMGFDFNNDKSNDNIIEADDDIIGVGSSIGGTMGSYGGSIRMKLGISNGGDKMSKYAAKAAKKAAKTNNSNNIYGTNSNAYQRTLGGLASSLAFTPVQGIELENPNKAFETDAETDGTKTYFSEMNTFSKISRTR